jgi:enolase (EC 4.2.1.11)
MAAARAAALVRGEPLHRSLCEKPSNLLPMPMFNVLNGGLHAPGSSLDFQEFMLVPMGRRVSVRPCAMPPRPITPSRSC